MSITCIIRTRTNIMDRRVAHITPKTSIVQSSIKCIWIMKWITMKTTSLFRLKRIPCNPLKQTPSFIDTLTWQSQICKGIRVSLFTPSSIMPKIFHLPTQYPHLARKAFKHLKYQQNSSWSNWGKWKIAHFF